MSLLAKSPIDSETVGAAGGGIAVDAHPPIVEVKGITKRFPNVVANDRIDLALRAGEVHALLGENGAGKSTIVDILSGLQQPDGGTILIDGRPAAISSPAEALRLGIGTVFQHIMLAPTLTVAENLLLGAAWWRKPDRAKLAADVAAIGRDLGFSVDLDAVTGSLSLGEQQQVEIIRALLRRSRVLILDESTSMLSPAGIEELGRIMRRLVARGLALVFITHKLDEARRFGDRITVLRRGRKVGELDSGSLRALDAASAVRQIVAMMFGSAEADESGAAPRQRTAREQAPLIELRGVSVEPGARGIGLSGIDLEVRPGEILGLAGIDGNGQKLLAEAIAGQAPIASGAVLFEGRAVQELSVGERRKLGLRYLTDDRLGEGSIAGFPLAANLVLKEIGNEPYWSHGIERPAVIRAHAEQLVKEFDVRTPGVDTPIGKLSGGNIQKALLARELSGKARFVVFNKPTHGLDHHTIAASRRRITDIAARGIGVLLISTDLDELLALCDRIAVMSRGRIAGTIANDGNARFNAGRLMIGEPVGNA